MDNNSPTRLFPELKAQSHEGAELNLVLYKSDTCFFCHRVMAAAKSLTIPLVVQDTQRDPKAYQNLVETGGKSQVPCLFINGKPLYESADIIGFFKDSVVVVTGS